MATAYISSKPEPVSLKPKSTTKQREFVVPKAELSENIQAYDKRVASRPSTDPFSWNNVALKKREVQMTPTAEAMAADPLYNTVGRMLGIDAKREWGEMYDKVLRVVDMAREKSGLSDDKLAEWIYKQIQRSPNVSSRRINDVLVYLGMYKGEPKQPVKTVVKTITKYVKQKVDEDQIVNKWLKGELDVRIS